MESNPDAFTSYRVKTSVQNAEHYLWEHKNDGWHLHKSDSLSVIQEKMMPGTSEVLHYHQTAQQVFYILKGVATFEINGRGQLLTEGESIHIPPKTLHKVSNTHSHELDFILISAPKAHGDRIDIIGYADELKEPIKTLNYEWLQKYFHVEKGDEVSLANPKEEIINKGGMIFYARMNNEIVGTASLLRESDAIFELGKMAVTEAAQGNHIGNMLIEHCFNVARQKGITKLTLYSNTKLGPAIHLYKKYGFTEVEMESGHYDRANIKMQKII